MTSTNYAGVLMDRQHSTKVFVRGSNPCICTKIWGLGLLGVDTSLAPRISEGFESLILHQIMTVLDVLNLFIIC